MSGSEAARRAGLKQYTLHRTESGLRAPTVQEIAALCKVYRVDAETRGILQAIARDLKEGVVSTRIIFQNPQKHQERIKRIEQASSLIRSFQSSVVIGLAQTPAYARVMMGERHTGAVVDELTGSRVDRQKVLEDGRRFVFLHTEGALRWHMGGPEVMAEQMDHLAALANRPNVRVGVIPWHRPVEIPSRHPFHIYDMHTVIVGTELGTAFIGDPVAVRDYDRRFSELESVAVFDDDARAELRRIATDYRGLR